MITDFAITLVKNNKKSKITYTNVSCLFDDGKKMVFGIDILWDKKQIEFYSDDYEDIETDIQEMILEKFMVTFPSIRIKKLLGEDFIKKVHI